MAVQMEQACKRALQRGVRGVRVGERGEAGRRSPGERWRFRTCSSLRVEQEQEEVGMGNDVQVACRDQGRTWT